MRNRSSKQAKEMERLKLKGEPHLSGAYIRSLVKQLTSSRPKEPMNTKAPDRGHGDGFHPSLSNLDEGLSESHPQPQPPPQPKKQVRRRLHTSRPYQERLLNMAEARREIVTALKFHRAAMKQANELQQQQPQSQLDPHPPSSLEPHERTKSSRRNPRIYPSNTTHPTTFSNYLNNPSVTPFSQHPPSPNPFPWVSPVAPLPLCDNLNLTLPNQPLGLNLNFHDFNNIDTTFCQYKSNNNPTIYASYSSSSSSSSTSSSSPSSSLSYTDALSAVDIPFTGAHHSAMDDEEMAKIRSIGEQHDIEWNDTLNLVTSARWFKFLKNIDTSPESSEERGDEEVFNWFDEVMDIPAWLTDGVVGNPSDGYVLQQHSDEFYSEDMMQDTALPCLDIGEIEGMDGEWLA